MKYYYFILLKLLLTRRLCNVFFNLYLFSRLKKNSEFTVGGRLPWPHLLHIYHDFGNWTNHSLLSILTSFGEVPCKNGLISTRRTFFDLLNKSKHIAQIVLLNGRLRGASESFWRRERRLRDASGGSEGVSNRHDGRAWMVNVAKIILY